jgi:hypothetical protein
MKNYKYFLLVLAILNFVSSSTNQNNNTVLSNNQRRNAEKSLQLKTKENLNDDNDKDEDDDSDLNELKSDDSSSKTTIPLIIPAPARITISLNAKKILKKRKKNFSKMAKSLIILNETDYEEIKRYLTTNNDTYKFARSFTKAIHTGKL